MAEPKTQIERDVEAARKALAALPPRVRMTLAAEAWSNSFPNEGANGDWLLTTVHTASSRFAVFVGSDGSVSFCTGPDNYRMHLPLDYLTPEQGRRLYEALRGIFGTDPYPNPYARLGALVVDTMAAAAELAAQRKGSPNG